MKFFDKIGRVSIKLNINEQQTFEGSILTKDEPVIQEIRDNGDRWTPPRPAGGSGDPHFTTLGFNSNVDQDISLNGKHIRISRKIDKIDLTYAIEVNFEIVFSNQKNAFLVSTTISQEFISKTRGLLENFNKNKQDDLTLPNGTIVSLDPDLDIDVFGKSSQFWLTNKQ
ncbi:unnamed protein product [Brachionus calyciflorus]|uniref:VWFD domain-containing protein n=1 Tax=Brachionus calyciflorus TaxID=104777 RepID=A0A814JM91_9BILA|nr:unnamed protein product [Brachionus calyciflorus]